MYKTTEILMRHAPEAFGLMDLLMSEYINNLQTIIAEKEAEAIQAGIAWSQMYDVLGILANYLIDNYKDFILAGRTEITYSEVAIQLIETLEAQKQALIKQVKDLAQEVVDCESK